MSDVSLPAKPEATCDGVPFDQAARSFGFKVALGVPVMIGVLAIIGAGIEHSTAVEQFALAFWATLLSIFSFGGNFWAAVSVSIFWISVLAWLVCVTVSLPSTGEEGTKSYLGAAGCASAALWLVSFSAVLNTFASFEALTVYQKTAVFASATPLGVCVVLWVLFTAVAVSMAQQKN